jgi:hypothetical protein
MSRAVKPLITDPSKLEAIRTGAKRKADLGTNVNKGVVQGKGGKYIVVEKEKKFEEAGVKRKKRNYVLYESKLGTEREKNMQKIEEPPKPKPKPKPVAKPRVEEKIIQKKKRIEYLDNYQYHETKNIKDTNPARQSIVTHQRLGDIIGGTYEETTYQRHTMTDSGKGPKLYSQQTTKTTTRRNVSGQPTTTTQKTTNVSRTIPAKSREQRREIKTITKNVQQKKPAQTQQATKKTITTTKTTTRTSKSPAPVSKTQTTTVKKTTTTTRTQSAGKGRTH